MKWRLYYDRGPLTLFRWFLHRAFKYEPPFQASRLQEEKGPRPKIEKKEVCLYF